MLCVLMTSWRPVVKYPGTDKLLNQERCEIGLSGYPDVVGILTPWESAKATDQSLVSLESCLSSMLRLAVCVHVSAVDAVFISVTGSIHMALNVYTFPFLCTSPSKIGKMGKLRLFREAM